MSRFVFCTSANRLSSYVNQPNGCHTATKIVPMLRARHSDSLVECVLSMCINRAMKVQCLTLCAIVAVRLRVLKDS